MSRKPDFTSKLLNSALHIAALVVLAIGNYQDLWLCLLLFGMFTLLSIVQSDFGDANKRAGVLSGVLLLMKYGVSVICAVMFHGQGPMFLFVILMLDVCIAYAPLPSVALTAVTLGTLLALSSSNPDTTLLQITLFVAVYLLAHTVKRERALGKSMAETISALRGSEKKLVETNRQITCFNAELEESAKLKERSRITKGIHDTLGHTLTAIIVQLSAARQRLGGEALARENIDNAYDQAKRGLGSVRETIHMLDDTGTSFANKMRHAIEYAQANMQIKVLAIIDADIDANTLVQQALLSALKEGLTNGVRHGGATAFVFKLEAKDDQVHLYLEDNGSGCTALAKGYGLTAMQEMVEQAGGAFEAAGLPGEGFYVRITVPSGNGNGEHSCRV